MSTQRKTHAKERLWTFDFILVLLVTHLVFDNLGYQFTVVPRIISDRGGSDWEIGFIIGTSGIGSLILRPWIGRYVGRAGAKRAALVGMLALAVGSALYLPVLDAWFMIMARVVLALGMPLASIATITIVANMASPSRRGEAMAYLGIAIGAAGLYAPSVGFYLYDSVGTSAAIVFGIVASLVGAVVATRMTRRNIEPNEPSSREELPLVSIPALFPTAVFLTHTITLAPVTIFLPLLSEDRNLGNPGTFFTVYSITQILVMTYSGRLSDRIGRAPIIIPGLVATVISMVILVPETNVWIFISSAFLNGLAYGLLGPGMLAFTVDRVALHERAAAVATLNTAWGLGSSGGGLILGPIASVFGVPSTFAIAGALSVIGLLGFIFGTSGTSNKASSRGGKSRPTHCKPI